MAWIITVLLMHITHLSLTNFRNYGRLELDLPVGPTLLHGNNAQGKTNLLEAIFYLATTRSPQAIKITSSLIGKPSRVKTQLLWGGSRPK